MQYFFILGNNPTLSIAELSTVFGLDTNIKSIPSQKAGKHELTLSENVFILKTDQVFNINELIKKIGGTIKIGIIKSRIEQEDDKIILDAVKKVLPPCNKGKFKFGISYYGKKKCNIKKLAMNIKKFLSDQNIGSRWVTSREPTLSSVVVEQNKLLTRGIEIVLIEGQGESEKRNPCLHLGQTLVVQPFKELSFRDYGRPARDDYSGMLPPKLAQIMINLSQAKPRSTILDPFCGSGTILTEAMIMGYKNLIGADISKKAIRDTKRNVEWTEDKFKISDLRFKIYEKDVFDLLKIVKPNSIDAIVAEPYLGPQRGKIDTRRVVKKLERLYSRSLIEFRKVLKENGRVIMIWPIFRTAHLTAQASNAEDVIPDLGSFKIINPIPEKLRKNKNIKLTKRNTIIYGREGQKVWREIAILE